MKKASKKFFGILGLMIVGIATAVAANLPTYAQSSNVEVRVNVQNSSPSVLFNGPLDGTDLFGDSIQIDLMYNQATQINYYLIRPDGLGGSVQEILPSHMVSTAPSAGTDRWTLNLAPYAHYGRYSIRAELDGHPIIEDIVSFERNAFNTQDNGTQDTTTDDHDPSTGNPVFNIQTANNLERLEITILDPATDNPILHNGNPVSTIFDPAASANPFHLNLFSLYDLPEGDYRIRFNPVTTAGISSGNPRYINFTYRKTRPAGQPVPNVPNTGGLSIAGITFSRTDSIISLAIILASTIIFFLLITRKKKSQRRTQR